MPVATKLQSHAKPVTEPRARAILKPGGNIVTVHEETTKRKKENLKKKTQVPKIQEREISDSVVGNNNVSLDSTCSSDSSSGNSLVKKVNSENGNGSAKMKRNNGFKPVRIVPDASHVSPPHKTSAPSKRCDWITPNAGKSVLASSYIFILICLCIYNIRLLCKCKHYKNNLLCIY